MKKLLAVLLSALMLFSLAACGGGGGEETTAPDTTVQAPDNPVIRMSTTTSVNDSGLLPYLLPVFEKATGYTVEVQSAGTGAAIQKAKDGNADLILVHAKASEEEFINEGYGVERKPFMYNFFVIVGPEADPAGIKDGAENAAEAFGKIADTKSTFISRGDESGTHKAELKIWGENVPDAEKEAWYINAGQGMGACLTMASEKGAYCLTDKATFLSNKDSLNLEIVLAEGEDMKNTYSLIECNPEKLDGVNTEGAKALIEWMMGAEASALIAEYGKEQYGQALFYLGQ
ncbi:MAG: substrate-binding domain-containing protein [Clostridia bacterium]|nr:substrate-binding domain-containing protein [Clostridia bacterium]